jgi:5'-nucleotidase
VTTEAGPRVLITNDDGIDSEGLAALARCVIDRGLATVIAAPATEASGTSAGLTAAEGDNRRVQVEKRTLPGLDDIETYAVAAHPAFIVLVACEGGFGAKPDIVLSGINRGANVGRAVLHSGTVGAALTAAVNGVRAMAVSLDGGFTGETDHHWDTAARVVGSLLPMLREMDEGTVLNLNIPDVPLDSELRLAWASLAEFGTVRSRVERVEDGIIETTAVTVDGEAEPGTDAALLAQGYATLTPLHSVTEDNSHPRPPLPPQVDPFTTPPQPLQTRQPPTSPRTVT